MGIRKEAVGGEAEARTIKSSNWVGLGSRKGKRGREERNLLTPMRYDPKASINATSAILHHIILNLRFQLRIYFCNCGYLVLSIIYH
jgi:hypothetical protein